MSSINLEEYLKGVKTLKSRITIANNKKQRDKEEMKKLRQELKRWNNNIANLMMKETNYNYHTILIEYYYNTKTIEAIAEAMQLSVSRIKSIKHETLQLIESEHLFR